MKDGGAVLRQPTEVTFGPVVTRPEKIVCAGFNYRVHAEETGTPIPELSVPDLYATMKNNLTTQLHGDHDVFGDGSVEVLRTPGHTPGHRSLLVRLRNAGVFVPAAMSPHFCDNFQHRRVPAFNADHDGSREPMDHVEDLVHAENATLLINHDARQSAQICRAPDFIE